MREIYYSPSKVSSFGSMRREDGQNSDVEEEEVERYGIA